MTAPMSNINPAYAETAKTVNPEGPQPLLRGIPPGEAYPVEALGPLREAVEAVHDIRQAPVAIAAQSALSVASLAVQGFADVETLGGDAPCSLFCLTVAVSGERKSGCDRLLMKGVRAFVDELAKAEAAARLQYELDAEIYAGKRKRLMLEAAGSDKIKATAAQADLKALGEPPRPPLSAVVTGTDPTVEGLLKLYPISRPSLGIFSDEAGAFVGGVAMSADNRMKTISGLSKLWDGDPLDRVRAGDGATRFPGRRLACHLLGTPVAVHPLLADREASGQGFLARFLITEPPSAVGTRIRRGHDPASDAALAAFTARLRGILETPMPTGDNPQELTPSRLPLSFAAKELLWGFYVATETPQKAGGALEMIQPYASKIAEQACRIAGVLTLWENLNAAEVTPQAMANGITLAQYYLAEAKRLCETGLVSTETANAERLRVWLMEKWPHADVTPSEIINRGPGDLRDRKVIKPLLAILVSAGWLVALEPGTEIRGAARKESYHIVRCGHDVL
ncbi:YfjI family protein [Paenirhodobacter enshiensis]|uniref:YfjI family protein n=1 Tax=Paenirhodobacter enshiensis TaxID=1105367 RepID=UPI003FA334AF